MYLVCIEYGMYMVCRCYMIQNRAVAQIFHALWRKVGKAEDVLPKLLEEIFGENQFVFFQKMIIHGGQRHV